MCIKTCSKCKIEKDINDFPIRDKVKNTYRNDCKNCRKVYKENNKEKFKAVSEKWRSNNKDKIRVQNKSRMDSWLQTNKDRNIENKRIYRLENKEKISEYKKNWYLKNKEDISLQRRVYRIENRAKLHVIGKEKWQKINSNKLLKLTDRIRKLIYISIKRQRIKKNSRTHDILGCSYEYFKIHIEEKFDKDMTWDNYGEWHFDHITPISWATSEEEVYLYNHYTNFQPLWEFDNISKLNRYSG